MRLLFVHQNFPGQYKHLAPHFARDPANTVVAISDRANFAGMPGYNIRRLFYDSPPPPAKEIHRYLRPIDHALRRAELVRDLAIELKREGFVPDIICAHPGWGEALLLKDVFERSPILGFHEFFYSSRGADVGFDPEFPSDEEAAYRIRLKNTVQLHNLDLCDWGVTPTHWQLAQYPERYRDTIDVIFDGVDTNALRPNPQVTLQINEKGIVLDRDNEVITFANRNLEPYRGFHVFMRSLPRLMRARPRAHIFIIGGNEISYGTPPATGETWRQVLLKEVGRDIDHSRLHFVGRLPYDKFVAILQLSSVHIYLTYPFILGRSMIEAMACECAVIGSATGPVQEVIEDGANGLLVDFFSTDRIVDAVNRILHHPIRMAQMRTAARRSVVERYDLMRVCLPAHIDLIKRLRHGQRPDG
jgi:glycosyltransferase involved in cell wall biosynthesis